MKEILVYKPRQNGEGVALRLNFRAADDEDKGGLFVEFAKQQGGPIKAGTYPTFGWGPEASGRVVGKLGLADITGMLAAYQQLRVVRGMLAWEKQTLPVGLAAKKGTDAARTLELFHKSGGGSLIITWQFTEAGSYFGASRAGKTGAPTRGSISLTMAEELLLVRYLERALDAFCDAGMR